MGWDYSRQGSNLQPSASEATTISVQNRFNFLAGQDLAEMCAGCKCKRGEVENTERSGVRKGFLVFLGVILVRA